MKFSVKPFNKDSAFLIALSIIIFFLTFPPIGGPVEIGLDPSFAFAFNYFFANNLQAGKDIIFTYGPLGFLFFIPQPISNNLFFSIIVISVFKLIFISSFLYLGLLVKKHASLVNRLFSLVIIFLTSALVDIGSILVFLTAIFLLIERETSRKIYLIPAIFIASFAIFVKSSLGVLSILIVMSYSVIDYFQGKNIRRLFFINSAIFLSFVFIWLLIYHNLSGIGNYLYGILELSSGNSSAMTLNPANNWVDLSIFIFLFFYLPFNAKDKRATFLYGIFLLSLLASWKYAFGRTDHIHYFYFFIIFFYSLLLVCMKYVKIMHLIILLVSLLSFSANMKSIGINPPNIIGDIKIYLANGVKIFNAIVLDYKNYEKELIRQSRDNLKQNALKKDVLQIIGDRPVDTYPWETTYVPANNLNWRPRPVFQSYVAYTPWLDRKNAEFFVSDKAPQFIIWDIEHWGGEVGSIDGRYLLSDEPLTIFRILNRYKPVYRDQKIALFERVSDPLFKEPKLISRTKGRWEEWIKVPSTSNGILRAKIDFTRKFLGRLKRFLYKEEEFFISYKLENNEIKKYRLVADNAISGVWINPLIVKLSNPLYGLSVKEIMLSHSRHDFIKSGLTIDWQFIETLNNEAFAETHIYESEARLQRIKVPGQTGNVAFHIDSFEDDMKTLKIFGWAHINGKGSENSKIYIVMKSKRNTYVFDTNLLERPDITAHFKTLNFDASGFSATILKNLIESGEYKLGIFIEKDGFEALRYTDKIITVHGSKKS